MYIILLYIYFNKRNEISERFDIFFTYSICKTILRLIWIFMYSLSCLNYELKTYVISWDNYLLIYSIKSRTSIHKSVYNQKTLYTDCIIISYVFAVYGRFSFQKKKFVTVLDGKIFREKIKIVPEWYFENLCAWRILSIDQLLLYNKKMMNYSNKDPLEVIFSRFDTAEEINYWKFLKRILS